jgi:cobalt-zinc-cadmium efflux system membrane fusion protein
VPSSAIQEHEGEKFVFVQIGEGLFKRRDVMVGRSSDGAVEITAGLGEGEPVVVQGAFALKSEMLGASVAEAGHAH